MNDGILRCMMSIVTYHSYIGQFELLMHGTASRDWLEDLYCDVSSG